MRQTSLHLLISIVLLLFLSLTTLVYWGGLGGPFLLDDMLNLSTLSQRGGVDNLETALAFIFSNESGVLGRPVTMASFLLNDVAWPSNSFSFKFTNLMIHLLIGVVAFYLIYRLAKRANYNELPSLLIAIFVSGVWLLHPFNVSTTLYVIQRMAQLSALFSLLAVLFYLIGRERQLNGSTNAYLFLFLAFCPFALLAVMSKENGLLSLGYIALAEYLLFKKQGFGRSERLMFNVVVLLPLLAFITYLVLKFGNYTARYEERNFTMLERLLTQGRVLFDYIHHTFIPTTYGTGLIHDDIVVSRSLTSPPSTLISLIGLGLMALFAFLLRNKLPLVSFGVFFFLVAHSIESNIIPLELYFEHRNYLPMIGLLVAFGAALYSVGGFISSKFAKFVVVLFLTFYALGSVAITHQQVRIWSNLFDLLTIWATEHPDSLRAQRIYGQFLGKQKLWAYEGMDVLKDAYQKFPEDASLPMAMLNIQCRYGVESPVSMQDTKAALGSGYYHGGIVTIAKNFGNYYVSGKCADESHRELSHSIIKLAANVSNIRGKAKADLLFYHAELYAQEGDLNNAMESLDEAAKYQRDFVIPFKQAQYLASAGLYDESLERLELARKWDNNATKNVLEPSNKRVIDYLEKKVLRAKQISTQ